jgi:hypothetical protein
MPDSFPKQNPEMINDIHNIKLDKESTNFTNQNMNINSQSVNNSVSYYEHVKLN